MRQRRLAGIIGISQSLMFAEHEWWEEECRLNKNDRCRTEECEEEGSIRLEDLELGVLDPIELLNPELLSEESEPDPLSAIHIEKIMMDREEIRARRRRRIRKSRFEPSF